MATDGGNEGLTTAATTMVQQRRQDARDRLRAFYGLQQQQQQEQQSQQTAQSEQRPTPPPVPVPSSSTAIVVPGGGPGQYDDTSAEEAAAAAIAIAASLRDMEPTQSDQSQPSQHQQHQQQQQQQQSGTSNAIYNFDSPNFDVRKSMQRTLRESHIPDLIAQRNRLSTDIRQLEGDIQTLVYENYSKFISATETVGQMRADVVNMDNEMTRLCSQISAISTKSAKVSEALQPTQQKIAQLSATQSMLSKLHFVYELPTLLQSCLAKGKLADAVKCYSRTAPLLERYRKLAVFRGIERDCRSIMVSVDNELGNRMHSADATMNEVNTTLELLVALGAQDMGELWRQYLQIQCDKLTGLRTVILESGRNVSLGGDVASRIILPNKAFLDELTAFIECFVKYFVPSASPSANSDQDADRQLRRIHRRLSKDERESARIEFGDALGDIADEYTEVLQDLLEMGNDLAVTVDTEIHLAVLTAVDTEIHARRALVTFADMGVTVRELADWWEEMFADRVFNQLKMAALERFLIFIDEPPAEFNSPDKPTSSALASPTDPSRQWTSKQLATLLNQVEGAIVQQVLAVCSPTVTRLLTQNVSFQARQGQGMSTFLWTQLQIAFDEFLETLPVELMDMAASSAVPRSLRVPSYGAPGALVMSRLALSFVNSMIDTIRRLLSPTLMNDDAAGQSDRDPATTSDGDKYGVLRLDAHHFATWRNCARKLLHRYIFSVGAEAGMEIRDALLTASSTEWAANLPPARVTPAWRSIRQRLAEIENHVRTLVGRDNVHDIMADEEPSHPSAATGSSGWSTSQGSTAAAAALESPERRVARTPHQAYNQAEFGSAGAVAAILRIALKEAIEVLRTLAFGRSGYQQMQVDTEYIRTAFTNLTSHGQSNPSASNNASGIELLLDELVNTAYSRCRDPVTLDHNVAVTLALLANRDDNLPTSANSPPSTHQRTPTRNTSSQPRAFGWL
ncbi:hypothetical protein GQ42DRAFT_164632 [Ramicandelaber brevisporus]|nr:hypothetical protein GQ42DRAFT_164632 [Ramicandelaber brevisporus]